MMLNNVLPWILGALLIAVIAALIVMWVRMNSALARAEQRVRAAGESARREALDEFLREIHVEERSHLRESKSMFTARRVMVLQERLCFRDIPLSNWVEQEMVLEEGTHPAARPASVFAIPPGPVN